MPSNAYIALMADLCLGQLPPTPDWLGPLVTWTNWGTDLDPPRGPTPTPLSSPSQRNVDNAPLLNQDMDGGWFISFSQGSQYMVFTPLLYFPLLPPLPPAGPPASLASSPTPRSLKAYALTLVWVGSVMQGPGAGLSMPTHIFAAPSGSGAGVWLTLGPSLGPSGVATDTQQLQVQVIIIIIIIIFFFFINGRHSKYDYETLNPEPLIP